MRNITYKYEVGDTVMFKPKHYFEADVMGTKVLVTAAEVVERRDYNGPCYALGGCQGFWKEDCFVGRYEDTDQSKPKTSYTTFKPLDSKRYYLKH